MKKKISEILVKYAMPTRQVVINEILVAFEQLVEEKTKEEILEELKHE